MTFSVVKPSSCGIDYQGSGSAFLEYPVAQISCIAVLFMLVVAPHRIIYIIGT